MKRYKRYDELPFEMLQSLTGKVNDKPLWGRPPGTVRMLWSATRQFDVFNRQYWDVHFHVTFEPDNYRLFPNPDGSSVLILNEELFGKGDLTPIEDSVEVNT